MKDKVGAVDELLLGLSAALVESGHDEDEADEIVGDVLDDLIGSGELEDTPEDEAEERDWVEVAKPMMLAKLSEMGFDLEDVASEGEPIDGDSDDIDVKKVVADIEDDGDMSFDDDGLDGEEDEEDESLS